MHGSLHPLSGKGALRTADVRRIHAEPTHTHLQRAFVHADEARAYRLETSVHESAGKASSNTQG